jgi:hypothetical protein
MDTMTATIIVVSLVALMSLVLVVTMLGGLDIGIYRSALAPFQNALDGSIMGPKWNPYFAGQYNGFPFTARYRNVRHGERHDAWKPIDEIRLKFMAPAGQKLRILNRDGEMLPMSYSLTFLKTIESGIKELDDGWVIYAADADAARALCHDIAFVGAVSDIFKIPYDRLDIMPDGIEIRERHYVPGGAGVRDRENILKAADAVCTLAGILRKR